MGRPGEWRRAASPAGKENPKLDTGAIEVAVEKLKVLNATKVPPFLINEEQAGLDEHLRLKYRYLDLRRPEMQQRIVLRARLARGAPFIRCDELPRDRDPDPGAQHPRGGARLSRA